MKLRTCVVCGGATLIVACGVPVAPQPAASAPRFAVAAFDGRGMEAPLDAIPRRPELVVTSTRTLEPIELVLLSGEPDPDVLDDLTKPPLRAANAQRSVPSRLVQRGAELRLVPERALEPDAPYLLALPGTARAAGGSAISDAGPAFATALRTLGSVTAGAAWMASLPAAGASDVPTNIEAVFVAADGALKLANDDDPDATASALEAAVWIETTDGSAVASRASRVDCAELESRAATCVRLEIAGGLYAGGAYVLRSSAGLRDLRGAPVEPLAAAFHTRATDDVEPPSYASLACAPDELRTGFGCLLVGDTWAELRARADESVRVAVRSWQRRSASGPQAPAEREPPRDAPPVAQLAAAGDVALTIHDLEPSSAFTLELEATDVAGNRTSARLDLTTTAPLATLTITEVLADPAGPDAAREYVEIANFGDQPVNAQGFTLADARGKPSHVAEATRIPAGARALLVADDFDPAAASFGEADEAEDAIQSAAIPPGTVVLHVGSALTQGGVQNAGEPLFLRDAEGQRLSAVPLRATPSGSCLQRRGTDARSAQPEDFVVSPCTPGRPP